MFREELSADELCEQGNLHTKDGHYDTALFLYNQAIHNDKACLNAYIGCGKSYYLRICEMSNYMGEFNNDRILRVKNELAALSIAYFTKALEIDSQSIEAYLGRGQLHAKQNNLELAFKDYCEALLLNSKNADRYFLDLLFYDSDFSEIKLEKERVFNWIKKLPFASENKLRLLTICLERNTILSHFFWTKKGLFDCDIKSGMLREINYHLFEIEQLPKLIWALQGPQLVNNGLNIDVFLLITSMLFDGIAGTQDTARDYILYINDLLFYRKMRDIPRNTNSLLRLFVNEDKNNEQKNEAREKYNTRTALFFNDTTLQVSRLNEIETTGLNVKKIINTR